MRHLQAGLLGLYLQNNIIQNDPGVFRLRMTPNERMHFTLPEQSVLEFQKKIDCSLRNTDLSGMTPASPQITNANFKKKEKKEARFKEFLQEEKKNTCIRTNMNLILYTYTIY